MSKKQCHFLAKHDGPVNQTHFSFKFDLDLYFESLWEYGLQLQTRLVYIVGLYSRD